MERQQQIEDAIVDGEAPSLHVSSCFLCFFFSLVSVNYKQMLGLCSFKTMEVTRPTFDFAYWAEHVEEANWVLRQT